jgi:hypothetical protein
LCDEAISVPEPAKVPSGVLSIRQLGRFSPSFQYALSLAVSFSKFLSFPTCALAYGDYAATSLLTLTALTNLTDLDVSLNATFENHCLEALARTTTSLMPSTFASSE